MEINSNKKRYCSLHETETTCRFFTAGQQSVCAGFEINAVSRKCGWWKHGIGDKYICTNKESQKWAEAQFKTMKGD